LAITARKPNVRRYRVSRVRLGSLLQAGLAVGCLLSIIPGLLCSGLTLFLASGLRALLERMSQIQFKLLGQTLTFNLTDPLGLGQVLATLRLWTDGSVLVFLIVMLFMGLLLGLGIAFILIVGGLGYNLVARLTRGIEIDLTDV